MKSFENLKKCVEDAIKKHKKSQAKKAKKSKKPEKPTNLGIRG